MASSIITLKTGSAPETRELGKAIGLSLNPGDTVCLSGGLGAGKTVMVQGMAEGIGTPSLVSSPTFTLMRQYPGRLLLLHLDLYRLESAAELEELGWEEFIGQQEFLGQESAVVIEWAERIKPYLPNDYLDVCLQTDREHPDQRLISLRGEGASGRSLLARLKPSLVYRYRTQAQT